MITYTHKCITIVSILITFSIFCIFYFSNLFIQSIFSNSNLSKDFNLLSFSNQKEENPISELNSVNNLVKAIITPKATTIPKKDEIRKNADNTNTNKTNENSSGKIDKLSYSENNEWKIVIPSIDLDAPISDGTSSDVMNEFVGHFENTSFFDGNVGLAAHNRGYPVNYFANVKKLSKGEIIQYYYHGKVKRYSIQTITVIDDTDWTYLRNTSDNRITLITCVEDEPEYRRCIQAIEIKK